MLMPYAGMLTEDELKKKEQAQGMTGPGSSYTQAQTQNQGTGAPGGGGMSTQAAPSAGARGSGWVNLQQYLTANQGKGRSSAETVANSTQGQIDSAIRGIESQATKAKEEIGKATVNRNEELERQIKDQPQRVDKDAFKAYASQTYQGPKALSETGGYKDVLGAYTRAKTNLDGLQNKDQRAEALRTSLNDARYSRGMSALDSLLMGQEGEEVFRGLRDKNQGIEQRRKELEGGVSDAAKKAQETSEASLKSLRDVTNQSYRDLLAANEQELMARNQGRGGEIDTAARALFGDQMADQYGIDRKQFMRYYAPPEAQYSLGDVVSDDERARMAALAELAGEADVFSGASRSGIQEGGYFDQAAYDQAVAEFLEAERQKTLDPVVSREDGVLVTRSGMKVPIPGPGSTGPGWYDPEIAKDPATWKEDSGIKNEGGAQVKDGKIVINGKDFIPGQAPIGDFGMPPVNDPYPTPPPRKGGGGSRTTSKSKQKNRA
jgi:hypothetical protein